MRIGTMVGYAGGFKESIQQVVELEAAGLDIAYVAEAYGFDGVSMMGYLAAKTESVQIASGILPLYTRTPTLLAMTAAGVDELSGGRAILGIGASGPQVIEGFHGVPYDAPLGRTREIIDICRKVWARQEPLVHQGKRYTVPLPSDQGTGLGKALKIIAKPQRADIPIHVAALGPKNVQLTAELADGWLPLLFHPGRARDVWDADLEIGLAKRSPDLGPLEVVAGSMLAIGDGAEAFRDFARPMVALYVGGMGARGKNFYNSLFQRYGYEEEAKVIQDLYLSGDKAGAAAAVPASFLEKSTLCGPLGYIKERVVEFAEAGVTVLNVVPLGEKPAQLVGQLKELVADL